MTNNLDHNNSSSAFDIDNFDYCNNSSVFDIDTKPSIFEEKKEGFLMRPKEVATCRIIIDPINIYEKEFLIEQKQIITSLLYNNQDSLYNNYQAEISQKYSPEFFLCSTKTDGINKNHEINEIKNIIENYSANETIKKRLLFLYKEGLEDEEDLPMQIESLKSFMFFASSGLRLKDFDIVLGPNGIIAIGWRESNSKLINIKFIDKENNYLIMYMPKNNPKDKFDKYKKIENISVKNIINGIKLDKEAYSWIKG